MGPITEADQISDIAFGFMGSKALFVALDHQIFTHLSKNALDADEIAGKTGLHRDRAETLLTGLAGLGLLTVKDGRFANAPGAEAFLVRGAKYDFGEYLRLQVGQQMYALIHQLGAAIAGRMPANATASYEDWFEDADEARKIGDLYASFMDTDAIAARGLDPVAPLLAAVDGLRDVRDLAALLGELERIGGHGLFGSYVDTDAKDSDRYLFNLTQGGLGLPDESYYRDEKFAETRTAYVAYLERLLALGGVDDAAGAAATVMDLDTRLAAGHWERAETRNVQKTYNLRTLAELKEVCPAFDWDAYVQNLTGTSVDPAPVLAEVCLRQPSYFEHLSAVLGEVPVEAWRTWLTSRVLRSAAPYLTDDLVETNFDFYGRTLNGTPELRARWKRAVTFVEGSMGEAVGKVYVARHFPPAAKAAMDDLVANLLAAYRESIGALDWMTEETKERAYEKLATFRPKIGYPERFRDYAALEVVRDDLVANVWAAAAFSTDRELRKIGSPVDRDEWFMLPQTVNAYYNPGTNEICFPAGILQKPFFDVDALDAENYGGIGAVIGHEVGHGFDDQGRKSDGDGNLKDWWTEEDAARFEERAKAEAARAGKLWALADLVLVLAKDIIDGIMVFAHAFYVIGKGDKFFAIGAAKAGQLQQLVAVLKILVESFLQHCAKIIPEQSIIAGEFLRLGFGTGNYRNSHIIFGK